MLDEVKTLERFCFILNRGLDVLCERFREAIKDLDKVEKSVKLKVVEMRDRLLCEMEGDYAKMCEDILVAEDDANGGVVSEEMMATVEKLCTEFCRTKINEDVILWVLGNTFASVHQVIDSQAVKTLVC